MKKESYYFPHDFNAHNDPKLIRLAMKGWDLVGLYWSIIGMLHEQGGWINKDYASLAFALRTDSERIAVLIDSDLFRTDGDKFTADRVLLNLSKMLEKSHKARESAQLSWIKRDRNTADAERTHSERNAKKRKEKKRKEIISSSFREPTIEQISAFCLERGNSIDPQYFWDKNHGIGWVDKNGNKYKDWKAVVRTWEKWGNNKGSALDKFIKGENNDQNGA